MPTSCRKPLYTPANGTGASSGATEGRGSSSACGAQLCAQRRVWHHPNTAEGQVRTPRSQMPASLPPSEGTAPGLLTPKQHKGNKTTGSPHGLPQRLHSEGGTPQGLQSCRRGHGERNEKLGWTPAQMRWVSKINLSTVKRSHKVWELLPALSPARSCSAASTRLRGAPWHRVAELQQGGDSAVAPPAPGGSGALGLVPRTCAWCRMSQGNPGGNWLPEAMQRHRAHMAVPPSPQPRQDRGRAVPRGVGPGEGEAVPKAPTQHHSCT